MTNDDQTPVTTTAPERRPVRFGTILWGVLLLVFAAAMAVSVIPALHVDPTTLALGACIAAGVLLVAAGVTATLTRGR
jgi:hypothetical protein